VTSSAVAWIAIAGAAAFLFTSEQQLSSRRTALRAFDQHAREAAEALANIRAGQQAYVAAGQGVASWVPKVAALIDQSIATVNALRSSATSAEAQQELVQVGAAIAQLSNVDRRARDYIRDDEQLMAGDVVFAEGGDVAMTALHQVEAARVAEYRAFDADEAALRRREAAVLGGAAALTVLILAILAFAHGPPVLRATPSTAGSPVVGAMAGAAKTAEGVSRKSPAGAPANPRTRPVSTAGAASIQPEFKPSSNPSLDPVDETPSDRSSESYEPLPESVHALRAAASLCTGFGAARDTGDLSRLLADAGHLMNATGLIVWLGTVDGGDLRPVLAHGYTDQTLARIPPVPRSADNAAAAAYRTASLQIVAARPGVSAGALVAPILASDGCIGALTAEIRDGGETLETVQALATIFAAQLAGVLGAAAGGESTDAVTVDRMVSA
jgi:hypothetical protein